MKKLLLITLLSILGFTVNAQYYQLRYDSVGIRSKLILSTVTTGANTDSLLTKKGNGGVYKLPNTLGQWSGISTGLNASTGRTSLGGTTIGQNLFTLVNPSAITFPRFNADNTVSSLDASSFRTAIGSAPSSGSTSYIQNQSASAQTGDYWISGNGRATSFIGNLAFRDTRTVNNLPSAFTTQNTGIRFDFKNTLDVDTPPVTNLGGSYAYVLTLAGYIDSSGGYPSQLSIGTQGLAHRIGTGASTWSAWKLFTLNDVTLNSGIVPVTTTSGRLTNTTVTTAELGYLSGVTSALQTQLNAKSNLSGGNTFTGTQILTASLNTASTAVTQTTGTNTTQIATTAFVQQEIATRTGWAVYTDNVYTSGSPLSISSGATTTLTNNASTVINSQLPTGVTSFYNSGTSKITPQNNGDSYLINVRFKAKSNNSSGLIDVMLDIGGALNVIDSETISLRKGSGIEQQINIVFDIYSASTFVANGGIIKINSIVGDTQIYDINYKITRVHKAK